MAGMGGKTPLNSMGYESEGPLSRFDEQEDGIGSKEDEASLTTGTFPSSQCGISSSFKSSVSEAPDNGEKSNSLAGLNPELSDSMPLLNSTSGNQGPSPTTGTFPSAQCGISSSSASSVSEASKSGEKSKAFAGLDPQLFDLNLPLESTTGSQDEPVLTSGTFPFAQFGNASSSTISVSAAPKKCDSLVEFNPLPSDLKPPMESTTQNQASH